MKNTHLVKLVIWILALTITSCNPINEKIFESGVSYELAQLREKQLSNINYNITFRIPDQKNQKITANELIEFDFKKVRKNPLLIDFRNPESYIKSVRINETKTDYIFKNEHIIISSADLLEGKNKIAIEFIAGNRALNRNDEYLYTLFVPDRACTAFPCFDQPSLKAIFKPTIITPENWIAVANSKLQENKNNKFVFDATKPISTYLFSFVAGKFDSVSKTFGDMTITMYHREKNDEKLKRNIDKIFELKYSSLKWLEEYTKIKYPFQKMDFIVVPSFQYGGMEHPGAVLYRDSKMFLDQSATIRDELNRANLIAHETAHMWFGDLVTMKWFSEVWLKEVFANFMAGKIVNPQYPEINHQLNFLINHYPSSYSVDRTLGANPIEQELDNMKNAGTLYGAIIYHKAPIVMSHLENIIGENKLQEGIHEYLSQNMYSNATWDDLIDILDSKTQQNLNQWSHAWVYESEMPYYSVFPEYNSDNQLSGVTIKQNDPKSKNRLWTQDMQITSFNNNSANRQKQTLNKQHTNINFNEKPNYVLYNSDGLAYGYFELDSLSKINLLQKASKLENPVNRCAAYICLWENLMNNNLKPLDLFNTYIESVAIETNAQNVNLVLGYIKTIYWRFLSNDTRKKVSIDIENLLWDKMNRSKNISIKASLFKAYYNVVISNKGLIQLLNIWNKTTVIKGLHLSERDFTKIALELAVKSQDERTMIISSQKKRITDSEKKIQFKFISEAITNPDVFFESLKDEKNREKEPWVGKALRYLHHPTRSSKAIKYIYPSLEILEELQATGDIFFPKQWLDAIFSGHSSIEACNEIERFLSTHPNYPLNLKNKILQSSDLVFRAKDLK